MAKKYPLAMTEASKKAVRSRPKKASLKKMKPEAFLEKSRPLQLGEGDRAIINEFKKQMQHGDPMGPLKLYEDGSEDGRHRAKAAQELGVKSVPVVDYREGKADGGPVMHVPTHLPIGDDPDAFFRRLALYSYSVAPLMPGRHGYAAGGLPKVRGSVSAAPDDVEAALNVARRVQMPPVDIAAAPPASRATLPSIDIGRPRPNYDRGESMRAYEPTTWERAAQWMMGQNKPSPERRALVEGIMGTSGLGDEKMSAPQAAHLAAHFLPPTALPATALDAAQMLYKGTVDPYDAAMMGMGLPGKSAKAASAFASGLLIDPAEAQAGPIKKALDLAKGIIAYHGSPHSFDRFDMSKIGTGEGAQAYGHGLYFADNEGVAKSYRDVLAGANNRFLSSGKGDGVVIENPIGDGWRAAMYQGEPGFKNRTDLPTRALDEQFFPTFDEALAHARQQGYIQHESPTLTYWSDEYHRPIDSEGIRNLEDLTGAQIVARNPGSMYQVRLNADPEHFLDWDRPLSEQSPVVQRAIYNNYKVKGYTGEQVPLSDVMRQYEQSGIEPSKAAEPYFRTGAHGAYTDLGDQYGGQSVASQKLREAGIPGIKYLDQGSRGAGEGSRNYVVFDPDIIDILRKYAKGGEVEGNYGKGGGVGDVVTKLLASLRKQRPDAMKRAREMGYDTRNVVFHGTDQPIEEFNPNVYVAKDPLIAEGYARKREYEPVQLDLFKPNPAPNIMPMFAKRGSVELTNPLAQYYKVSDPSHLRSVFADFSPEHAESANLMKAHGGEVKGYAGGGRLTGDALKAALETAERFIAPTRRLVAPDEKMLAMHQVSSSMLPRIRDLGALPAPSIGVGMMEHDPLDFGDITLMGRPHMAIPSETNPIFGQDVWSPRVPTLYPLTPDQIAEFGGAKHALLTKEGFIPATPENIVTQMKKRPIIGGEYLTGKHDEADPELGYVISSLTPKFGSFEEMSAARGRLLPRTRANDQYVALHAEHEKLANALDRSRFNPGASDDDPVQRLGRAILFEDQHKGSNFYDAFKTFYPGASDPQKEWFRQHVENIRNLPTSYFEAKPQRVVDFGEFGGAVVPQQKWNEVSPILKQMGINKFRIYDQFGAAASPPGYTHSEALRDFPELSFKRGGRAGYDDGGLIDSALSFLSQFNPVGEARAETPMTAAGAAALNLAKKYGRQTVNNPYRKAFPGIYGNPKEIAQEAESRVAPESPALKQLFGVTRQDLYDIGAGRVGNAEPNLAFKPNARGSESTENMMTRRNASRLQDVLYEAGQMPGLKTGMDPWYVMDPLYQRMVQLMGKDEATRQFNLLNHATGTMSPGSPVTTEINRGLAAYHLKNFGRYDDFVKHGGNPAAATEILPNRNRSFAEEFPDLLGHPYHSTSQAPILERYFETGEHGMQSPKVPLYIQSSGVPETGFQTKLPVPDAHFTRAVGLSDTRRAEAGAGDSMKMSEFQQVGPWFSKAVAKKVGLEAVPAQARLWGAMSGQTGVDTAIGSPKIEMIANEIMRIANKYGISPDRARDMVLQGELFNRGGSVIQDALDVSSKISRMREKEAA